MKENKFNQNKYIRDWKKQNMKKVGATYKNEFVDEFKEACTKLELKQSDVFKKAMLDVIDKAKK